MRQFARAQPDARFQGAVQCLFPGLRQDPLGDVVDLHQAGHVLADFAGYRRIGELGMPDLAVRRSPPARGAIDAFRQRGHLAAARGFVVAVDEIHAEGGADKRVGGRAEDRRQRGVGVDDRALAIQQRHADGREPHGVAKPQLAALEGFAQSFRLHFGKGLGPRKHQGDAEQQQRRDHPGAERHLHLGGARGQAGLGIGTEIEFPLAAIQVQRHRAVEEPFRFVPLRRLHRFRIQHLFRAAAIADVADRECDMPPCRQQGRLDEGAHVQGCVDPALQRRAPRTDRCRYAEPVDRCIQHDTGQWLAHLLHQLHAAADPHLSVVAGRCHGGMAHGLRKHVVADGCLVCGRPRLEIEDRAVVRTHAGWADDVEPLPCIAQAELQGLQLRAIQVGGVSQSHHVRIPFADVQCVDIALPLRCTGTVDRCEQRNAATGDQFVIDQALPQEFGDRFGFRGELGLGSLQFTLLGIAPIQQHQQQRGEQGKQREDVTLQRCAQPRPESIHPGAAKELHRIQHSRCRDRCGMNGGPHDRRARACVARPRPYTHAVSVIDIPGVHWLRRGSRNRLAHAEGVAFLVNPAAKL